MMIDTAEMDEAMACMARIKQELGIADEVKASPGILDDPVWWLEHAMDEVTDEPGLGAGDRAACQRILRKIRDAAWDCQCGRIDAMYQELSEDGFASSRRRNGNE